MAAPVSHHLLANVLGRGWSFLSTFLFVPIYVYILGIDGFGVIALFLAVSGLVAYLDLGLSPTLARELHDQRKSAAEKATLLYSYEIVCAAIVCLVAAFALLTPAAGFGFLLTPGDLAKPEVASAIRLVFVAAAVQMLLNFYVAGLMGVEDQIRGNLVIVTAGIVRSAGVIIPLWFYPRPAVYLFWQVVFVLLFSVIARHFLYRSVGGDRLSAPRAFEPRVVLQNIRFTGGMFVVAVTAAVNTQMDKLFIGKLEGMSALAEYSLVATFAQLLVFVVSPVTLTMLPRFVRSATSGNAEELRESFLVTYRLVAMIVCAAIGTMLFFGPYIISVWAVGQVQVSSVAVYSGLLITGYAFLALGTVPHLVAVANKDLRGGLVLSLSVVLTVPTYWYSIRASGALGAAATWLVLQAIAVPLYTAWVNRKYVNVKDSMGLALSTLLAPSAVSIAVNFLVARMAFPTGHRALDFAWIAVSLTITTCCCAFIMLRRQDLEYLSRPVSRRAS